MDTDARTAAEGLLSSVWSRIAGPDVVPVDPVRIANELGLDVFYAELPDEVSGSILKDPGHDPVILLNAADSKNRRRFTCAHELGHYIVKADAPSNYEYVDFRGPLASEGVDPEEVFANQFASNLLMPKKAVIKEWERGLTPAEMAYRFHVSLEAMTHRLTKLGLKR